MSRSKANIKSSEGSFETVAVQVVRRLRSAVRGVIGGLPQAGALRKAADLQRCLEIDSKLAWQVHKLAFAVDPTAGSLHFPKSVSMMRFLDAAAKRGASADRVESAQEAMAELDQLIKVHAGDRGAFDSMLSGLHAGASEELDMFHKRAAFNASSHFLGVQAKVNLGCTVYHPSASDPERFDALVLHGKLGLRRLRRGTSWIASWVRAADEDDIKLQPVVREPLEPEAEALHGVSLLTEFCSKPLPKILQTPVSDDTINFEISNDGIGNAQAVTAILGDVYRRAFVRYRDAHNRIQCSRITVRTPSAVLVQDVLVHEGLFDPAEPRLSVYSDHRDQSPIVVGGVRESDRLSVQETVVRLGQGLDDLYTPDVPRYPEMVEYALHRMGWDPEKFEVWRCRVEYPVMPSTVTVQFDLPHKAGG
jgi:hypothetical protein